MDPWTHAVVGVGVATLGGEGFAPADPVHLGVVLGALAPDIDIILQVFGDVPYLTHHRGFTHSVAGVLAASAVIAGGLGLILGGSMVEIFLWTVFGGISHLLLDTFNSYGAKVLWPFSRKSYSLNLLVLADPVIILLFTGLVFWPGMPQSVGETVLWAAAVYIGLRYYMRRKVSMRLWRRYGHENPERIVVMPSFISLWKWSFLMETEDTYVVGEVRYFSLKAVIVKILLKNPAHPLINIALETKLGRIFRSFTPYFHVYHYLKDGKHVIRFCDLRYFLREDFLHHATLVFDETQTLIDAVFQPYHKNRKTRVMG